MKTSMSRSTFKILFYVKKGSERANGYLPLMCRLTVDGEIKQFSCKLDVPPKLWDVKTARATGKSAEAQKINAAVDRIRCNLQIFLCLFLEKLNMPQDTPVTKAS